ncbi:SusE domain-containing protein [uncultured Bacteroides sp.]|uniref:SusE domain-containing protein n=1 Tax=uncultured Bacteroides sp. TaxID=162156 RepID=UPI00280A65E6|nr:SusE domain-containing protein [uncultured Bacteroides sp.]
MKNIINYIAVLGIAPLFWACDSDLETATYDETAAKPAVLAAINESYVLDRNNTGATAIEFTWEAPQMGYNAAVTNNLEMDVKGKDFGDKKVVLSALSGTATSVSVTHKDLNDRVLEILKAYNMDEGQVELEFRISSTISEAASAILSNVISTKVTPYNNEGKVAAKLAAIEGSYVLDETQPDATALTLNWEPAYVGDDLTPIYKVEINLEENNIFNREIVATLKGETSYSFTTAELNNLVIGLLSKYEQEFGTAKVLFRILASSSSTDPQLASEAVETLLTPYGESVQINAPANVDLSTDDLTLTWTAGTGENMRYNIEMDLAGKDFAQKMVVATAVEGTTYDVNREELNKWIGYLQFVYDENTTGKVTATESRDVEFRVCAYSDNNPVPVPSEAVTVACRRYYEENEDIFLVNGDYNGWNTINGLKLYNTGNNIFSGMIYHNFLGKWLLYKGDWNDKWWKYASELKNNEGEVQFSKDASNCPSLTTPCWYFSFNGDNQKLYYKKPANTWSVSGQSGSNTFAQSMYPLNDDNNYWLETSMDMQQGTTWIISSDIDSAENITPNKVNGNFMKKDDAHFLIPETGNYTIKWYFNYAEPFIVIIKN